MTSRLEALREAADLAWSSAKEAPADRRAPLLAQYRALLAEIDELGGSGAGEERTGLSEFERRLAERSGAAAPRRSAR